VNVRFVDISGIVVFALLKLVELLVITVDNFFPQYSIYAPNSYY